MLLGLTGFWLATSAALLAAGANIVSKLSEGTAYDYGGAPVVGPAGIVYWQDTVTAGNVQTLRINSTSGVVASKVRTNDLGDFPIGGPTDATATHVANSGQHITPGSQGGFEGRGAVFLDGTTLVADRTSTIAGLTNGPTFNMQTAQIDSDGSVVFLAQTQQIGMTKVYAVCRSTGGSSTVIASSESTNVPGTSTKFTFLWAPTVSHGVVLFYGEGASRRGLYALKGGAVSTVFDNTMSLPGVPTVPSFDYSTLQYANDGDNFALAIYNFGGGVWKRINGTWSLVAKTLTPIPDGDGNFFAMGFPAIRGTRVAFIGGRDNQFSLPRQAGIYIEDGAGGLTALLNSDDDFGLHHAEQINGAAGGRWWGKDDTMAVEAFSSEDYSWCSIMKVVIVPPTLTANPDDLSIRGTLATRLDVLANDLGPFGTPLRVTAVTQGAAGKVTLAAGKVSYTPGKTFTGRDTFTYTISAGGAETATATVTVTNPFLALRGSFSTLVTGTGGGAVGTLDATLTAGGVITGKLDIAGKSFVLRGSAGFDGVFTQTFKRLPAPTPSLVLTLAFDINSDLDASLSGGVTGDPTAYTIAAGSVGLTALPPGVLAARYTLLLPDDATPENPRGFGWAAGSLTKLGKLTLAGRLGDDTPFTAAATLNAADLAVLYVPLYTKPKGEISGALAFAGSGPRTLLTGTLAWRKPPQAKPLATALFPAGFTATTAASGASYLPPLTGVRALQFTDPVNAKANLVVTGPFTLSSTVSVSKADQVTADTPVLPTNVKVTITRATGLLSGSFVPSVGAKSVRFTGVLRQDTNLGVAYYRGPAQTGTVTIMPQ